MRNNGRKHESSRDEGSDRGSRFGMEMVTQRSSQARKQIAGWTDSIRRQAKEHPVRTIAVAVGAGYLLGGGLFSRLTGRLVATGVRLGLRLAVIPFVTQSIVALGEGLFAPGDQDAEDVDDSSGTGSRARQNRSTTEEKETHS